MWAIVLSIPTILEFSCIYSGISRDIINRWKNGDRRKVTSEYVDTVKKWYAECELAQVQDQGIKSIFLLKSNFGYNDNLAAIPLEAQNVRVSTEQLPQFDNVMLTDNANENT